MPALHPSITVIDCHYMSPEKAAVFMIEEGDRVVFVDNNTNLAIPHLLDALKAAGRRPEDVEYAIVTHVHLDHAGGTAALIKQCPNATVLAHPKTARHLADPSRIVAGARMVYPDGEFDRLYGEILPVPDDRIRVMEDGEVLAWGTRSLRFFYTKGHASHHFCVHDSGSNAVYAGDAFGLGRTSEARPGVPFTVCSCSPPEFDPEEARKSAQAIVDTGATWALSTHFGAFDDLETRAKQLLRSIDQMDAIGKAAADSDLEGDALLDFCNERVVVAFKEHLAWCGVEDEAADYNWLALDAYLNGSGLVAYATRLRNTAG